MAGKGSGRAPKTERQMRQELARNNPDVEYLSGYVNYSVKAMFQCKVCGYTWQMAPKAVCKGRECPACVRKREYDRKATSEEYFRQRLAEVLPGYELVSPYGGMSEKATVRCPKGHERTLRASTFIKRPDLGRCRECNPPEASEDIDEETLRREYIEEGLGLTEISQRHHRSFSFITRRMKQYGIETRPRKEAYNISRDVLEELYIQQALPVTDIADQLGCSVACLYRYLEKYGFPKRNSGYGPTE